MEDILKDASTTVAFQQLELIKRRKSPVGFSQTPIDDEELEIIFEATRWAASSYNEQPWRFILANKDQSSLYNQILGCINEHNRNWAKNAPVLILTFVKRTFGSNQRANKHAWHDLGLAIGNMSIQATAMEIFLHQMGGILPEEVYDTFKIPDDFEVVSAIAMGRLSSLDELDDNLKARELRGRVRKPLSELVFKGEWGEGLF